MSGSVECWLNWLAEDSNKLDVRSSCWLRHSLDASTNLLLFMEAVLAAAAPLGSVSCCTVAERLMLWFMPRLSLPTPARAVDEREYWA